MAFPLIPTPRNGAAVNSRYRISAIKTGRECRSSLLAVVRRADTATVPPPPNTVAEADCSRLSCCAGQCELSLPPTLSSGASTSKHRERHRRGVKLRHLLWGHASCEDSAERLQRLTAREALVSLGLSYSGLGMFWLGRLGPGVGK